MTLFAGALLRTIEFVMVTTDASFPGPGEHGRDGSRELGSRAADARRGEGRPVAGDWAGVRGTLCTPLTPKPAEERPGCRASLDRGAEVRDTHQSPPGPPRRYRLKVQQFLARLLD